MMGNRKLQISVLLIALGAHGCDNDDLNSGDHFAYAAFDSRQSFDANLRGLNDVNEITSKTFDRIATGIDPVTGASVMFGAVGGEIEMMSFRRYDQFIAANDLKSLADLEKAFKLPSETRRIKAKCEIMQTGECAEVFYLCAASDAPPSRDLCAVMLASARGGTKMWTAVSWNKANR